MSESKKLRRSLIIAALALLVALLSVSTATFAWYIYHTNVRTTEVKMSAGSSVSLQISNERDAGYGSSTIMADFEGALTPVSTDKISRGFIRVEKFDTVAGDGRLVATLFGESPVLAEKEAMDYHKTSLFIRTGSDNVDVYLSEITPDNVQEDSDEIPTPIATALRIGLRVLQKDKNGDYPEYIFEVTSKESPYRNTSDNCDIYRYDPALEGVDYVMDSMRNVDPQNVPNGTITTEFDLYDSSNFCNYDKTTGRVTLKPDGASKKLFTLTKEKDAEYSDPVEVEVYLWLEGCDPDCTAEIGGSTLNNLTLCFAGYCGEGT